MKKIVIVTISLFLILGGYIIVDYLTYSPLKEQEFKNLFPNYDYSGKIKKSVDFVGLSLHGELFDVFIYKLSKMDINNGYPSKNKWTNITTSEEFTISIWQKNPIDSLTFAKCKDIFELGNQSNRVYASFITELSNPANYYSYLYVNALEYYFFLYCPNKQHLYYVRKRGW